jgi:hypothetical protein
VIYQCSQTIEPCNSGDVINKTRQMLIGLPGARAECTIPARVRAPHPPSSTGHTTYCVVYAREFGPENIERLRAAPGLFASVLALRARHELHVALPHRGNGASQTAASRNV